MGLATRLTERYPKGLFVPISRGFLLRLKRLSLARRLGCWVSSTDGSSEPKIPAWIGDAYVATSLLVALALLAVGPGSWPTAPTLFLVAWAVYRSLELAIFLLSWLVVDAGPLHSYRRSVIAFSFNVVEIAALATILDRVFGCIGGGSFDLFWAHLTAMVALDGTGMDARTGVCRLVLGGRFIFSGVMLLLAVGIVAGGLMRQEIEN